MRKQLTELMIENLSPPKAGRLEIFDSIVPALALRVSKAGAKSFVVRTRIRGQSAPIRLTVGDARGMKLTDARTAASNLLRECRAGEDPRERIKAEKVKAERDEALVWETVVEGFIEKHAKAKTRSWRNTQAHFARHVTPKWRGRLLTEITRTDVVALLDRIEGEVSLYQANRALAAIRKLFNWAMLRGLISATPIVSGMAREGEESRERFLTFDEIATVWRASERIGAPFGPLFRFLLLTGQRRGEVSAARWASFDLDSERLWTLTPEETKASRSHLVPLSGLALDLLTAQPRIGDPDAKPKGDGPAPAVFVFTTTGRSPLSGFAKAKVKLDEAIEAIVREDAAARGEDPDQAPAFTPWRAHDLRRTVATHMEDALGIPPHIVGSVLNHSPTGYKGVTAVYTRGDLIYARRRALVAWARLLGLIIDGGEVWRTVATILRPETEADAARTDKLRRAIQADDVTWTKYLRALTARGAKVAVEAVS